VALQQLRQNLDSANKTLSAREQDVNLLSNKLRVTQAQKTQLEEDWTATEAQNVNISLALQTKVGDLRAAQAELETVKSKLLSLRNASTRQESVLRERLSVAATDVQSLTTQHKVQEAARHDLQELLSSKGKELNSTHATLAKVESRLAALVTQLGILQQVHLESEARERNFREVMEHNLTTALGNKDYELSNLYSEMGAIKAKLQGVETALKQSEQARQFLLAEQLNKNVTLDKLRKALGVADNRALKTAEEERSTNASLQETASEVHRLRKALAVANDKALEATVSDKAHDATFEAMASASEVDILRKTLEVAHDKAAGEERWINATLEAKASEVDKLRSELAVANDKVLEAEEEVTALKREGSELKVHDATLEATASEVDRSRNALAVANDKASGEEGWSSATPEARASEVDRLRAALAVANVKALEASEEIAALKQMGSELKVHDANLQREFEFAMAKDAKLNKKLTFDKSDRATLARDLMQVIDRLRVEVRRTRDGGMEADAQQVEHELNVAQAALKDSVEQRSHLASAVESTLAAMTTELGVRDMQLRTDRSLLEDALANATALQSEVHGLTKALKVEDHAVKAAHMLLDTARADVKDLVTAHHAWQSEPVQKLQTEVKKMHKVIQHDEKLIHQYQRHERRLRARLRFAE